MVHLAHILIYPIKSLDGVAVNQATVLESGALQGDREFAIVDYQGKFVNGKRTAAVHKIRSSFDLIARTVSLQAQETLQAATFHLDTERIPLESWLSDYFGFPVKLIQNAEMGFPDDTDSPGPTIISTATLQALATWFPGLSLEDLRQRLRTNLEIAETDAFWEEQLYGLAGDIVPFHVGAVQLLGINPCQRCVVPTRDPETGQSYASFQKIFLAKRKETLPSWAAASRFNHFYRVAVNTRVPTSEVRKTLQMQDVVSLTAPQI
ncbi:MAG: MOSC domain-containing protein [Leptolyngbyaceae cyanobacterium RU_5_1]|nr:MOSC domain-containing protein [Leptolyngbyaceae cyanobacterium RU_5_1]